MRSLGHKPFLRNPYAVDKTAFLSAPYDQVSVTLSELTIINAGLFGVKSGKKAGDWWPIEAFFRDETIVEG